MTKTQGNAHTLNLYRCVLVLNHDHDGEIHQIQTTIACCIYEVHEGL